VLALSTVHKVDELNGFIERERRRPAKTSTNAAIVRKVFGDNVRKKLDIPLLIDDYNHHMGGVDLANQYRAAYETHRSTFRSWWPIFFWLIDAAIVNAYRIQHIRLEELNTPKKEFPSQLKFRENLYQRLFSFATASNRQKSSGQLPLMRLDYKLQHQWVQRSKKTGCIWCRYKLRQEGKRRVQHPVILALQPNLDGINNKRASQTAFGCSACNVALCRKKSCWVDFHSK